MGFSCGLPSEFRWGCSSLFRWPCWKHFANLVRRLLPYAFYIQWYVSLAMAFAMGYLLASARHTAFDAIGIVAVFVVFLGACTKAAFFFVFRTSD